MCHDSDPTGALLDDANPPERRIVAAPDQDPTALGEEVLSAAEEIRSLTGDEARPVRPPTLLIGCCEKDDISLQRRFAFGQFEQRQQVDD